MRHPITVLLAALLVVAAGPAPVAAAALPRPAARPIPGAVVRAYDAPQPDWLPGHRGVDLAGGVGDVVVAAADGRISVAGPIAGRGVVVVVHADVRTTYEPVEALVVVGDVVARGQPIARLVAGHPGCTADACLHWGLRRGETYLDPLSLLRAPTIRLVPDGQRRAHQPAWRRRLRPCAPSTSGCGGGPGPTRAGPPAA